MGDDAQTQMPGAAGEPPSPVDAIFKRQFGETLPKTPGKPFLPIDAEENVWRHRWLLIGPLATPTYDLSWAIQKEIAVVVTLELTAIAKREVDSDRLSCLLQLLMIRDPNVKTKGDVRALMERRLDDWRKGNFEKIWAEGYALAQDAVRPIQPLSETGRLRAFEELVKEGRYRAATGIIANRQA